MKGKLIDERTGLMECPECKRTWTASVKPQSNGKFHRGSMQCPYCK